MVTFVNSLKKKQRLTYKHSTNSKSYKLKVICKERWGEETVVKCKVIGNTNWYEYIYLTCEDYGRIQAW